MIGRWTWNLYFALIGGAMTFGFAYATNVFTTSLLRGIYAFACFFIIGYAVRYGLGTWVGLSKPGGGRTERSLVGQNINLETPQDIAGFKPLEIPRIDTQAIDASKAANAVRILGQEDDK